MRKRETVLAELKSAVAQERACTLRVLHLLREVESDRHFLEMGYPSLFEFATQELGYSAAAAHRRIQSMRLLKALPEMENKIEDGSLSLCVAAKTQSFFRQEELKREKKFSVESKREIVQSMLGVSSRECEKKLAELSPESNPGETISITISPELAEKLEKLKSLLSHQNPQGRMDQLLNLLADIALKKLDPEKKKTSLPTLEVKHARYVPASIKQAVWKRDQGVCGYTDLKTGKKCGSQRFLQLDHREPYSLGGETSISNLRLRCAAHNLHEATKVFGEIKMRSYLR
jgi:hypothetical protein